MIRQRTLFFTFLFAATVASAYGITVQELTQRAKELPTVPEKELPPLKNKPEAFQGVLKHPGFNAHTWVKFPFVENPGSLGIDPKGRIFVSEANRFWQGVPDLRGSNELIREDFQAVTVDDRLKLYEKYKALYPPTFFTDTADRIIRLEDRDGNGAADHRTLFSDYFNQPLDGIGFSILAEDDAVYFTCIPNLWKMTDQNDDGVADSHDAIVEGFGVHVSFIGHDLHGITRGPDGRLYFSVGDRAYHVTGDDGTIYSEPGRGAIFRCDSDGRNFEVFCRGLRNPQELVFDEYGNLFTFDNTGDIGDVARMVYALEGSDSGWNMAHQSAHHYVTHLDWESFHPKKSMWVEEKMFETYTEEQPQWVYPPASHVAEGPSGVTYLSGASLPEDLRGKFLLANYRGPSENCTVLIVGYEPKGAGYIATPKEVLVEGVGVTDVELGFDGNIYLCDFGGGWSINTNGAIQVLVPKDTKQKAAGKNVAAIMSGGFKGESVDGLVQLVNSPDKRVRQAAQFELVKRAAEGAEALNSIAKNKGIAVTSRLHGVWGLEQCGKGEDLLHLLGDSEQEIRANAARSLGSLRFSGARDRLVETLNDESPRVRSLSAIALGRVAEKGDPKAIDALYGMAAVTGASGLDPVLRHACLSGLEQVGTEEAAVARANAIEKEVRLTALLFLRRQESGGVAKFLSDSDPLIRNEAVRAIYDTSAVDGAAGRQLSDLGANISEFPKTIQRRIVAANYRLGGDDSAQGLVAIAGADGLDASVREAALHALQLWEKKIVTDPVLGTYRPLSGGERSMSALGSAIGDSLKKMLGRDLPPNLAALALNLAERSGVEVEEETLRTFVGKKGLDPEVRVAALDGLVSAVNEGALPLVEKLIKDKNASVSAAAMSHGFALNVKGIIDQAKQAVTSGPLKKARAGIDGLNQSNPKVVSKFWEEKESAKIRSQLWLDLYLALQLSTDESAKKLAAEYAVSDPKAVFRLSESGGNVSRGELVFRNQGACLQCHKVGSNGGIQGPALTKVGERLSPEKMVESLVNPNAEVAKGFGLSSITLKDGTVTMGQIAEETDEILKVAGIDGKLLEILRKDVDAVTPPVSAMPPMGLSLPPRDLRDLIAYLISRGGKNAGPGKSAESHGEGDEKIAK